MDTRYLTNEFGKGLKKRGQALEGGWAHQQDQEALRKLREKPQQQAQGESSPKPRQP